MIELERHIEILLLSNDCVIVPDFGGFMAHHVEARYDEHDHSFIPPLRTLGFNPQLTMNDSLLAQSYAESYDISYPEALRRIEDEVEELRQHLNNEGSYELNDLGVLSLNSEGRLEFAPCEAGILTPELYGLSAFQMNQLSAAPQFMDTEQQPLIEFTDEPDEDLQPSAKVVEMPHEEELPAEETADEPHESTITIKMSWIRNTVASIAAAVAFLMFTSPIANSRLDASQQAQQPVQSSVAFTLPKAEATSQPAQDAQPQATQAGQQPTQEPTVQEPASEPKVETGYCLVLASQVTLRNAEDYVSRLKRQGLDEARIYTSQSMMRVVYGSYPTEQDAYNALRSLRTTNNEHFREAWIYQLK